MRRFLVVAMVASCMLLQGCFTMMSVDNEKYWAVPAAVPLDIVTSPAQMMGLGIIIWKVSGAK